MNREAEKAERERYVFQKFIETSNLPIRSYPISATQCIDMR
jgi:hypothetical protein